MQSWTCILPFLIIGSNASRMLFLAPIGTKSHKIFYSGIVNALAERGHHMTILSSYKPNTAVTNVREITLSTFNASDILLNVFQHDNIEILMKMMYQLPSSCADALEADETQKLLNETFDLVFLTNSWSDCFLPVVQHFQVPSISVSTLYMGPVSERMGLPVLSSIAPGIIFPVSRRADQTLTFLGRMINCVTEWGNYFSFRYSYLSKYETESRKRGLYKGDKSFFEMSYNFSLNINNAITNLESPLKPGMINMLNLGGLHCQPPKPLPKNLEEWLEGSKEHGFILFSLGSWARPSDMSKQMLDDILSVFRSLKQKIIWKCDMEIENLPTNVLLVKWLPQQDLLGDPRIRLFITHGGLFSTQEAIYHSVPLIGMPLFADQYVNMYQMEEVGIGKILIWKEFTADTLNRTIYEVMNNKRIRQNIEKRSKIMKDLPVPLKEQLVYWVEYVLRHNGAHHLRSPASDLNLFELYNVDVWSCLILICIITMWINVKLIIWLCRSCRQSNAKLKKQ